MLLHAVRTIHGNTIRPDNARYPIRFAYHCAAAVRLSTGLWDDDFSEMHSAMDDFLERNLGRQLCHAIHLHGPNTFIHPPCVSSCNVMSFSVARRSHVRRPPDTIEMDGASRQYPFRSSNLSHPLPYLYPSRLMSCFCSGFVGDDLLICEDVNDNVYSAC